MANLISVQNLTKSFGGLHAVRGISFSVSKGEVLGFLGCNGAGKTTTMQMLAGYLPSDKGDISICGQTMTTDAYELRKHIGYLPEGGPLYQDMRTKDMLCFMATMLQLSGAKKRERIDYVTHVLHLEPVLHQSIDTLSKGYRRRIALALALLHDPEVLILDEPTDGLDPNQKHEVQELIAGITKDKAIIISTHILDEVEALCKRALIIEKGQVIASGTIPQLIKRADSKAGNLTEAFRILTHPYRSNHVS